jgi:hypothetical protein
MLTCAAGVADILVRPRPHILAYLSAPEAFLILNQDGDGTINLEEFSLHIFEQIGKVYLIFPISLAPSLPPLCHRRGAFCSIFWLKESYIKYLRFKTILLSHAYIFYFIIYFFISQASKIIRKPWNFARLRIPRRSLSTFLCVSLLTISNSVKYT